MKSQVTILSSGKYDKQAIKATPIGSSDTHQTAKRVAKRNPAKPMYKGYWI
jgi:hypothetical protein